MIEYPKALYKDGIGTRFEELPCVVVNSPEEEAEQNAAGWFQIGAAPVVAQSDDVESLRAALTEKGIAVDKRWGLARLREELEKVA